jgi:6-phosphogluconate dehydrogenase
MRQIMQIGLLGLGRMGGNMAARLLRGGHQVVVADRHAENVEAAVKEGAVAADNLSGIVAKLSGRRIVWLMIPSGEPVEKAVIELSGLLSAGDIVIDGGNSFYKDSVRRASFLKEKGLHYIDAGTSGGVWGLANGYCLMVGGDAEPVTHCEPVFKTLAPKDGYLHTGPAGAGHFVKMVHNGIEYGMMQAYAEGFEILQKAPFTLDLPAISHLWEQGSVVRSWLLELATAALKKDPTLDHVKAWVADSGEGRWTVQQAVETGVPAYAISAALFARFASREDDAFGLRLLSALRNQFGGHPIKTGDKP